MRGDACNFGGSCKYSHDVLGFLSRKEPDLGPRCHNFDTYGLCVNGLMCRYGDCHIDRTSGLNLTRSEAEGGVLERGSVNTLSKDVQVLLRKKKYHSWPEKKKGRDDRGGAESKDAAVGAVVGAGADAAVGTGVGTGVGAGASAEMVVAETETAETVAAVAEIIEPTIADIVEPTVTGTDTGTDAGTDAGAGTDSAATLPPQTQTQPTEKPQKDKMANFKPFPSRSKKLVDFCNKVYVAPLTTVGNLPFRRILSDYGADITCGEMAMTNNIVQGQASEWALLKRHSSERCFGVQLAGGYADTVGLTSRILEQETSTDFVDLNCGCPIDLVCNKGAGSALMNKPKRLYEIVDAMCKGLPSRSVTVKIRTGWSDKHPVAHEIVPQLQKRFHGNVAAIMIHGRSRLQRYHRLANWEYVLQCAQAQSPALPRIPVIGNGDILSWEDWRLHQHLIGENAHNLVVTNPGAKAGAGGGEAGTGASGAEIEGAPSDLGGLTNCAMLGRGALVKPWLPREIKEQRNIDIPATERLEIIKTFWMLASSQSNDWIKISEMFLGPVGGEYAFNAKHKTNSYAPDAETLPEG
ncbi:hypothetical protein B484DRAFT_446154 [Ochromonadaceae sp. CCMP2298]|nr:hypothetical protein B484DRAFT_446154 [Ochromonadaceae sp. CCMP2298]